VVTGVRTVLVTDLGVNGPPLGLTTGSDGSLWCVSQGGGLLSAVSFVFQRIADHGEGSVETTATNAFHWTYLQAQLSSLA